MNTMELSNRCRKLQAMIRAADKLGATANKLGESDISDSMGDVVGKLHRIREIALGDLICLAAKEIRFGNRLPISDVIFACKG